MSKHTPGPWTANGSHIYAPDGSIIAQVHNSGARDSDYPLMANRDLMSAAPDMLKALRKFAAIEIWLDGPHVTENMPNGYSDPQLWREHVFAARKAIAAATGEV